MSRPRFSLVIPVYNEEKNLPTTLVRLKSWVEKGNGDREVVFSDDGSTDRSVAIIEAESCSGFRILKAEKNMGKGAAVRRGVLAANGDYIVFTDCDLAYGMASVRNFFRVLSRGDRDMVIGSRTLCSNGYGGYTLWRSAVSRLYILLLKATVGLAQTDSQCGIKGFSADAAKAVFSECRIDGFAFDLEVLTVAEELNMRISELPVTVINHEQKYSKVRLIRDMFKMLADAKSIRKEHSGAVRKR